MELKNPQAQNGGQSRFRNQFQTFFSKMGPQKVYNVTQKAESDPIRYKTKLNSDVLCLHAKQSKSRITLNTLDPD